MVPFVRLRAGQTREVSIVRLIDEIVRMTDLLIIELTNYGRFTYSSFRLPSVRLRPKPRTMTIIV